MNEHIHTTKDGERIPLSQLENRHLINIIKFIKRRAEGGVDKFGGVFGNIEEDMLYGLEALEYLNYDIYVNELERRLEANERTKTTTSN
jgi:hypothetical protein